MKHSRLAALAIVVCLLPTISVQGGQAGKLLRVPVAGEEFTVRLSWRASVDLDLFLTGPSGETIYFGNRTAREGYALKKESTCDTLNGDIGEHSETATIPSAVPGTYRVSVDYIFDCGSGIGETDALISLTNNSTGKAVGSNRFTVSLQRLKTVAWEFEVLQK